MHLGDEQPRELALLGARDLARPSAVADVHSRSTLRAKGGNPFEGAQHSRFDGAPPHFCFTRSITSSPSAAAARRPAALHGAGLRESEGVVGVLANGRVAAASAAAVAPPLGDAAAVPPPAGVRNVASTRGAAGVVAIGLARGRDRLLLLAACADLGRF